MKLKLSFPVALLALSLGGLLLMNCGNEALETRPLLPAPNDYNFLHPASIPCGEENEDLSYKVPLSDAQEERALRVYRESIVILAHVHCVEPWDFEEMLQGGITAVILKVDTDGMNVRMARELITRLTRTGCPAPPSPSAAYRIWLLSRKAKSSSCGR